MKREQTYKTSLEFLEARKYEINSYGNNSEGAVPTLKQITGRITGGDHLGVVIAFHYDNYLDRLLKIVHYQYNQKKSDEIERNIAILYLYAYDCFFKYLPIYKPIFEFFRPRIEKLVDKRTYRDFGGENSRCELMQKLLKQYQQSNFEGKELYERGKDLIQFVKNLSKEEPVTCFEECVFTWIRIQVEDAHSRIVKQKEKQEVGFCCSLHFEENGFRRQVETLTQNFSKELPPIPSRKILKEESEVKDAMKRQVVSYLNSTGGIHYIGIDHNAQREARFLGVPLSDSDRKEVLSFILNEIVMRIFPTQDENEDEDQKQEEARIEKFRQERINDFSKKENTFSQQYELNRYVSVDFLPIYSRQTLFYSRSTYGTINYIVRVKVKLGDPFEVYHFINEKEIPEAYFRENNKERKLTMIQYYDEVYKRLKDKANNISSDRPKVHALCRFDININSKTTK